MLKKVLKVKLGAVSAIALVIGSATLAVAQPEVRSRIIGMSSNGAVYLEAVGGDPGTSPTYRLVSNTGAPAITLEAPSDAPYFYIYGLSPDGKYVLGQYYDTVAGQYKYVVWNNGAYTPVSIDNALSIEVNGIGNDGKVFGQYSGEDEVYRAFVWQNGTLTTAPTDSESYSGTGAGAISRDGKTVVGYVNRVDDGNHAMVWNVSSNTINDIDTIYNYSGAYLVSKDGSVVAGWGSENGDTAQGVFRWTSAGMVDIGRLSEGQYMGANAMSASGNAIVGYGTVLEEATGYYVDHAYRYIVDASGQGTLTDLGTLHPSPENGYSYSRANAVSENGDYVVGDSYTSTIGQQGFRWSQATGMISVNDWLASANVEVGYSAYSADYISDNGNVVIGYTNDSQIYVARVGEISGIITEEEFYPTVVQVGSSTIQNSVSSANTIMFGAQGNPMRNLLGVGERSAWGTVDGGYDNSDISKGGLALGEFGLGYGIVDGVTARFSVGGTYTKQDLDAGGWVKQKGYYLSPEVSADLGSNLYLTVGGYFSRTNIDTSRGYLNGSTQDYSNGSTNADTWGAKVRLDWLNAANFANTDVTPYVGLSYARTTVDAYSETGGSFPVSYDETSDHSTIARIGADFVRPMSDTVRLLAKTEVSYQFEDHAAATSGTLTGIDTFSIEGQDLKKFWVRGGIGAEVDIAGGTASFMVNATTQGQDPTVWLRSNYTVKF